MPSSLLSPPRRSADASSRTAGDRLGKVMVGAIDRAALVPLQPAAAAPCCVCLAHEDYNASALVVCARCGLSVHVRCYGRSVSGDLSAWHCEPCELVLAKGEAAVPVPPQCAVCPVAGGALRLTSQRDVWCHVLCINWIPELSHSLAGELDERVDIALLDPSRDSLRCLVCGLRGGCIQCVSGRCARSFHVTCAFRAPSSLIFTGYNEANQQVYHCKTHLSDVSSRQYEMVDDSWKALEHARAHMREHPVVPGRCRYCATKFTPANQDVHEDQCILGWLAKEDVRARKLLLTRHGVTPVAISRSKKASSADSKQRSKAGRASNESKRASTSGKARRQQGSSNVPVRPCPECGEHVRETLMMGHLRNDCVHAKHAKHAGKHGKWKRKHAASPTAAGAVDPGTLERDGLLNGLDLTDVLFDSWPGQNAGAPMNAAHLWKVVNRHFFSDKMVVKKRLDQLCKSLCGAKIDDIANHKRRPLATDLHCRDTVLVGRETPDSRALAVQTTVHRCDFMMRASRTHCMSDYFAQPFIEIVPHGSGSATQSPPSQTQRVDSQPSLNLAGDVRVVFSNINESELAASCKYSMRMSGEEAIDQEASQETESSVWTTFCHDDLSTLAGVLNDWKLPLSPEANLLVAADGVSVLDAAHHPSAFAAIAATTSALQQQSFEKEDVTPAINLLVEHLNEQMQQNRCTLRSLARKLEVVEHRDASFQVIAQATEMYYKELAAWKQLCKSLIVGYRGTKSLAAITAELSGELEQPKIEEQGEGEEEEPIDDGTCVVCFDGQSPESNPIVFCDRCELAVHQRCYGIVKVPSSEFICDRCKVERDGLDPATAVFCQLCSLGDGAFKRTIDGKWVHVVCALWCPKVWIGNLLELSDINLVGTTSNATRFRDTIAEVQALTTSAAAGGVANGSSEKKCNGEKADEPSQTLCQGDLCMYCRVACGRTVKCCHPGCSVSFHPLCGWFEGLPMTVALTDSGFVYGGGGAGLKFEMLCKGHLPADYSESERLVQRQRRRKVRIDAFFVLKNKNSFYNHSRLPSGVDGSVPLLSGSIVQAIIAAQESAEEDATHGDSATQPDWTDMAMCSACFEFIVPVVGELTDINLLHRRQFMMRCQYCNIYIHPECCISDIGPSAAIFRSNWICERCIQLGDKKAGDGCVTCGHSGDYLMPCASSTESAGLKQLTLSGKVLPRVPGTQTNGGKPPRPHPASGAAHAQALAARGAQHHKQPGAKNSPRSHENGDAAATHSEPALTFDKWIHVYCCKWKKTKVVKRHHIQHSHPPPPPSSSAASATQLASGRCELCFKRSVRSARSSPSVHGPCSHTDTFAAGRARWMRSVPEAVPSHLRSQEEALLRALEPSRVEVLLRRPRPDQRGLRREAAVVDHP